MTQPLWIQEEVCNHALPTHDLPQPNKSGHSNTHYRGCSWLWTRWENCAGSATQTLAKLAAVTKITEHVMCNARKVSCTSFPSCVGNSVWGRWGSASTTSLESTKNNVKEGGDSLLSAHPCMCGCSPVFGKSSVVCMHKDKIKRLIVESATIHRLGQESVNAPSLLGATTFVHT